jgi:tetratricopeptide (TPR) repeat protein
MDSSPSTTNFNNDNANNWSSTVSLFHLDQGNTHMVNFQYKAAIQSFTNCIHSTSLDLTTTTKTTTTTTNNTDGDDDDDDIKLRKLISFRAHSHRSQAYLELSSNTKAKKDALKSHTFLSSLVFSSSSSTNSNNNNINTPMTIQNHIIESKFEIAMSFIRLGKAYMGLQDYDNAMDAFGKARCLIKEEKNDKEGYDYDYEHVGFMVSACEMKCMQHVQMSNRLKESKDRLRELGMKFPEDEDEYEQEENYWREEDEEEEEEYYDEEEEDLEEEVEDEHSTSTKNDHRETKNESTTKPTPATAASITTTNNNNNTATSATIKTTSSDNKKPTCPKYQYYQNETFMTISILEPNLNESKIKASFSFDKLTVLVTKHNITFTVICGTLFSPIVVSKCKVKFMQDKVLIKLKKKHGHDWHTLFGAGASKDDKKKEGEAVNEVRVIGSAGDEVNENNRSSTKFASAAATPTPTATVKGTINAAPTSGPNQTNTTTNSTSISTSIKNRPYASHRDWDAIERDIAEEEENEKPDGESGFHSFMQKIYKDADEDTRRAMIKSYQTSGGTHLSCNWNEVEKTDYEKQRTGEFNVMCTDLNILVYGYLFITR